MPMRSICRGIVGVNVGVEVAHYRGFFFLSLNINCMCWILPLQNTQSLHGFENYFFFKEKWGFLYKLRPQKKKLETIETGGGFVGVGSAPRREASGASGIREGYGFVPMCKAAEPSGGVPKCMHEPMFRTAPMCEAAPMCRNAPRYESAPICRTVPRKLRAPGAADRGKGVPSPPFDFFGDRFGILSARAPFCVRGMSQNFPKNSNP